MALKRNLVANFLGQAWVAIMGVAFIPVYIRFLGVEAFGLIAAYATLQAALNLFSAGITPALGREMARFTAKKHTPRSIRDLLFTIELILLGMSGIFVILILFSSEFLSLHYLNTTELNSTIVSKAIILMGFIAALRLMEGIYRSSLVGLQKQVKFNIYNSIIVSCKGLFGSITVIFVSQSIIAFFVSQLIVVSASVFFLRLAALVEIPTVKTKASFDVSGLKKIAKFAGGTFLITISVLLITQTDKVILPSLVPLEHFSYYGIATTIATSAILISSPVAQAFQPKMVQLIEANEVDKLARAFHSSAQLISTLMAGIAFTIYLYAEWILLIWTGNSAIVENTSPVLKVLIIGTLINSLLVSPYIAQIAHAWTSPTICINIAFSLFTIPSLIYFVPIYGINAAAFVWLILNICAFCVAPIIFFKRILKSEKYIWYIYDIIIPISISFMVSFLIFEVSFAKLENNILIALSAISLILMSTICTALFCSELNSHYKKFFKIIRWKI